MNGYKIKDIIGASEMWIKNNKTLIENNPDDENVDFWRGFVCALETQKRMIESYLLSIEADFGHPYHNN